MAIWYNLWPFGIVCGHLLCFWYAWTKKNLATLVEIVVDTKYKVGMCVDADMLH
jgi:hypothetical protein